MALEQILINHKKMWGPYILIYMEATTLFPISLFFRRVFKHSLAMPPPWSRGSARCGQTWACWCRRGKSHCCWVRRHCSWQRQIPHGISGGPPSNGFKPHFPIDGQKLEVNPLGLGTNRSCSWLFITFFLPMLFHMFDGEIWCCFWPWFSKSCTIPKRTHTPKITHF